ncbi:MAG: hypothetical protein M1832_001564 [Thelocarpon impressellum]|nr:MAG: hypothetical protein M1832_001564 [Thelocarpon impressellum]
MTEDEAYRASTQYRLWSFTPEALASLRASTNALAAERVRAAMERDQSSKTSKDAKETDCLTVDEELKLVRFYCSKAMDLADFCGFPTNVKATAVQYLKRFYLSNSPMTYHPKTIMPCALFLATKTENHYTALEKFASRMPKTTPEDVIAAEVLIVQALRFTLDVRHPFRALEGGVMELLALAEGTGGLPPGRHADVGSIKEELLHLPPADGSSASPSTLDELKTRIRTAHGKAKDVLKTSAQLSDAYLLYTPAQIWLAALLLADEPLSRLYLSTKLFPRPGILAKALAAVDSLASLLCSSAAALDLPELKRIDKKLYACRNPEKLDLLDLSRRKREGGEGDEEAAAKKRRLERERRERDGEVFGGDVGGR